MSLPEWSGRAIALTASPLVGPTTIRPTVVLFATDPAVRTAARAKLPLAAAVVSAPTWPVVPVVAATADCVLLVGGDAAALIHHVRDLSAIPGRGWAAVVVCAAVSPWDRDDLVGAGAAGVLPIDASAPTLWGEVQHAVSAALLARAVTRFAAEPRLGDALRPALIHLCATDPPPTSVRALAEAVHAHRRTLWYQWRRRVRAPAPRVEDVVTTVVLLRASMRRVRGASWGAAAAAVGVHRHTIARGAVRVLGISALPLYAGEAADIAAAAARRAFLENVARPALRGQAP